MLDGNISTSFWFGILSYCGNRMIFVNEYMEDHILNFRERDKLMVDHCSYTNNLSSCVIEA